MLNEASGREVLLTEPLAWGMRLSLIDLMLVRAGAWWVLHSVRSSVFNSDTVPEDAELVTLLRSYHDGVLTYVNSEIGSSTVAMPCVAAHFPETARHWASLNGAALGFINRMQAEAVYTAITRLRWQRRSSCRSPLWLTAKPRFRPVRSACAMLRASKSLTTRCSPLSSPGLR